MDVLIVRSEISSTLGRKTATCELPLESERRLSHGESWTELLLFKKKADLEANAIPNVNPSFLCTFVSPHGENTLFVSVLDSPESSRVERMMREETVRIEDFGIAIDDDWERLKLELDLVLLCCTKSSETVQRLGGKLYQINYRGKH